ncbi:DUF721 domain-containing protein [Gluconacetobacter entanii]|uniref:DUF721 domain-containing protein n=1 Tax=Gluconacetobacter entanii TaxID=108528 RepID=A0A318PSF5_9PROT|nr:DUF721 domain-containing protein [Gluconacetobacter entanii]MCE2579225.1 DUF721 domain-containing protein [Komagataeibacter sp. FNDCR1]PYD62904.1 hypothetical protein CFR72_09945 [Gluconacetobacter entanii]
MTKEPTRGKRKKAATPTAQKPAPAARSTAAAPKAEAPNRARRLCSLGALMPAVTRPTFRRQSPAAVQVMLDWADIVGPELARVTVPRRLSGGTLTVACAGPVATELPYLAPGLIARINGVCGTGVVSRIKPLQDLALRPAPPPPRPRPVPAPVEIGDMPEGPLRDSLSRLGGWIGQRGASRRRGG